MKCGVRAALLGLGLTVPGAALHAQNCVPPEEMKRDLAGTPSVDSINALGVWFAQHELFDCAVQAFATSLQTDPGQRDLPYIAFEFGAALLYSGDSAGSITAFQQAESFGYRGVKLNVLLATALDEQHLTVQAIEEWRRALEYDPDAAAQLDSLSRDLIEAGKYQDTADLLQQPRVLPHRTVAQFLHLAAALVQLGKPEDAATALEDGINTYPSSGEIAHQLAALLTSLKRDAEAAVVLKLAVEQAAGATGRPEERPVACCQ
jgi:tetratricopeptide (TPR) repeat protein